MTAEDVTDDTVSKGKMGSVIYTRYRFIAGQSRKAQVRISSKELQRYGKDLPALVNDLFEIEFHRLTKRLTTKTRT